MSVENRRNLLRTELERFVEVASEEFGADKVILFGSLAQALEEDEEAVDEWSDLDLIVVAQTERPFYERIKQLMKLARPKIGVDVLVYTPLEWKRMEAKRSFIKREVLEKGKVVYERAE